MRLQFSGLCGASRCISISPRLRWRIVFLYWLSRMAVGFFQLSSTILALRNYAKVVYFLHGSGYTGTYFPALASSYSLTATALHILYILRHHVIPGMHLVLWDIHSGDSWVHFDLFDDHTDCTSVFIWYWERCLPLILFFSADSGMKDIYMACCCWSHFCIVSTVLRC